MTKPIRLAEIFEKIINLAFTEFSDVVADAKLLFTASGAFERLRIFLQDRSFVDIWLSPSGKYSYHWEQRHVRGLIHRHDNSPHYKWRNVKTFPKHFHNGGEDSVEESYIPDDPLLGAEFFLNFVRDFLKKSFKNR